MAGTNMVLDISTLTTILTRRRSRPATIRIKVFLTTTTIAMRYI